MYGNEDGTIPATYQILYFIAWKPDESQVIMLWKLHLRKYKFSKLLIKSKSRLNEEVLKFRWKISQK